MNSVKENLMKARKEYLELQEQLNVADPEFIDSVIYKLKSKEAEMEALQNELFQDTITESICKTVEIEKKTKNIKFNWSMLRNKIRFGKSRISSS